MTTLGEATIENGAVAPSVTISAVANHAFLTTGDLATITADRFI
jgi:hypothetical protein